MDGRKVDARDGDSDGDSIASVDSTSSLVCDQYGYGSTRFDMIEQTWSEVARGDTWDPVYTTCAACGASIEELNSPSLCGEHRMCDTCMRRMCCMFPICSFCFHRDTVCAPRNSIAHRRAHREYVRVHSAIRRGANGVKLRLQSGAWLEASLTPCGWNRTTWHWHKNRDPVSGRKELDTDRVWCCACRAEFRADRKGGVAYPDGWGPNTMLFCASKPIGTVQDECQRAFHKKCLLNIQLYAKDERELRDPDHALVCTYCLYRKVEASAGLLDEREVMTAALAPTHVIVDTDSESDDDPADMVMLPDTSACARSGAGAGAGAGSGAGSGAGAGAT